MKFFNNFLVGPLVVGLFYFLQAELTSVTEFINQIILRSTPTEHSIAPIVMLCVSTTVLFALGIILAVSSSDALSGTYRFTAWMKEKRHEGYLFRHIIGSASATMSGFASLDLILSRHTDKAFNQSLDSVSALYFSVVTFATVGYGDIFPLSNTARAVVATEVLVSMGYFIFIFSSISGYITPPDKSASDSD
jgi:hypothetical protein